MISLPWVLLLITLWLVSLYAAHRITAIKAQSEFEQKIDNEIKVLTQGFEAQINHLMHARDDFKTAFAEIIVKDLMNGDQSEIRNILARLVDGGASGWRSCFEGLKQLANRAEGADGETRAEGSEEG